MSYPKKLLRVRPTKGIASDVPANEVGPDFYTTGNNVVFRNGFAQRIGGSRAVYGTLPAAVRHMLNARIDTTNFWLFFGDDTVHALETSNDDDVTGSTLTPIDAPWQYASTILNGVPCFTNGFDAPRYWGGDVGVPFADLPDWPSGTICKSLVAFKFHLVALDIDGPDGHFESMVIVSSAAEPGTVPASWTPAADNEADRFVIGDTIGPAMCAVALRGTLLIFKRSATYGMNYVENPNGPGEFSVQQLFDSRGALTRHSAVSVGSQVFVVSDGDIALTDGTNWQSVAQGRMKDFLFSQLDQDNYENLFVVFHRAKNEVWVCFPESGNAYPTKAIVYDVATDAFGVRDLADVPCAAVGVVNDTATDESYDADSGTFDSDESLFNAVNFSLATESLVIGYGTTSEMQDTGDNVAVAASVGKYDMTFDAPERVKFVRRVHVRAQPGFGTLYVRVGARMSPTDTITWSTEQTLSEPEQIVNCFAQGRYISVEVRGQDGNVWVVSGLDLEAELRGYF
jgi:hypothetical protein